MNFAYLYGKYCGFGSVVVEDRSYDGLVITGAPKPPPSVFAGWAAKERELAGSEAYHESVLSRELEQRVEAARARALLDIVPFHDRVREQERAAYDQAMQLRKEAIECQSAINIKEGLEKAWIEIAKAQDIVNAEAQKYLDDTAFVLSWEASAVPAEIAQKRREAQARIKLGKTVYQDWTRFRASEMPSGQEIHEAIQKGGEHIERIRSLARAVALKYPRPRTY